MKKVQSAKAAVASKKNLADQEAKQAFKNRISNDNEMIMMGFVIGAVVVLLGGLLGHYISITL